MSKKRPTKLEKIQFLVNQPHLRVIFDKQIETMVEMVRSSYIDPSDLVEVVAFRIIETQLQEALDYSNYIDTVVEVYQETYNAQEITFLYKLAHDEMYLRISEKASPCIADIMTRCAPITTRALEKVTAEMDL